MKKRLLWTIFKYGLGLVLLAWVIWKNWEPAPGSAGPGLREALQRPIQMLPLMLATLICTGSLFLTFIRWYVLVRAQELPFTLVNAMRLGLIGFFLSTFLPGSVGGDIIKAYFIARDQSRRTVAVATVLLDRVIGLWALFCLVAMLGSIFWLLGDPAIVGQWSLEVVLVGSLVVVGTSAVVWLLMGALTPESAERFAGWLERIPKLGQAVAEFWRAVWMYRRKGRSVAIAIALSLIGHVGFVLTFYFAALTFQPDPSAIPSLRQHFVLVPVGLTIQALFPSPGGVGGGEYGFGKLYSLLGFQEANGVLGSLAQRVIYWTLGLAGYVIYLRMRPALKSATQPEPAAPMVGQPVPDLGPA